MRISQAALALIQQDRAEQRNYLVRWNTRWKRFSLVGGHKETNESFMQCLLREAEEELGVHAGIDIQVADQPIARADYVAWSESRQEMTQYEIELFQISLLNSVVSQAISEVPENRWVSLAEIVSGRCADGQPIDDSVNRMIHQAGQHLSDTGRQGQPPRGASEMTKRRKSRVELRNSVSDQLVGKLSEQIERELDLLFPAKSGAIIAYQLIRGFEPDQWRKLVLAVKTGDGRDPRRHIVKIGHYDAVSSDYANWEKCTAGRRVSGRMFMNVRLVPFPAEQAGQPARAGVVYEDATPLYGPQQAEEQVTTLADAALDAVKNNDLDIASVERVLRQTYAELGRWFFDDALIDPEAADAFFRRKLRFHKPDPVLAMWNAGALERLRADAIWLLGQVSSRHKSLPNYVDPIEYLEWAFRHVRPEMPPTLVGRSHGDFHGRNILLGVSRGEVEYPVIVDYGDMSADNALIWDFAKQETELKVRLLNWLVDDESARAEVLQQAPVGHLKNLVRDWEKPRKFSSEDRQTRELLFAQLFEELLHAESSGIDACASLDFHDTQEARRTPVEKALAILARVRLEAAVQLGRHRIQADDWRQEYLFALAVYGASTAKFPDSAYSSRLRKFALISAGCAVARLSSFRTLLKHSIESPPLATGSLSDSAPKATNSASDFVGPAASYLIPLHHAQAMWAEQERPTDAAALLNQARKSFRHAAPLHGEYALLLTSIDRPYDANVILEELARQHTTELRGTVRETIIARCRTFGDFETLSRFGGAYKKLADQSWESQTPLVPFTKLKTIPAYQHYATAFEFYHAAFEFSRDHYPGGNAAVMALLSHQPVLAQELAEEVAVICRSVRQSDLTPDLRHWLFCTEATVALLQGDGNAAANFQRDALFSMSEVHPQFVQTTYDQLCRLWHVLDKKSVEQVIQVIEQHPAVKNPPTAGPLGNCNRPSS